MTAYRDSWVQVAKLLDSQSTGNYPETGLGETNGDLIEADFWPEFGQEHESPRLWLESWRARRTALPQSCSLLHESRSRDCDSRFAATPILLKQDLVAALESSQMGAHGFASASSIALLQCLQDFAVLCIGELFARRQEQAFGNEFQ
jgi:hypothetical protein